MEEMDSAQPLRLELWKKIFRYAAPYKRRFLAVGGLMALTASIEAVPALPHGLGSRQYVAIDRKARSGCRPFIAVYGALMRRSGRTSIKRLSMDFGRPRSRWA